MIAPANDYEKGFNRGYIQLSIVNSTEAREKLNRALGCNNRQMFFNYKRGICKCSAVQAARVEEVFAEYGISNIWGE